MRARGGAAGTGRVGGIEEDSELVTAAVTRAKIRRKPTTTRSVFALARSVFANQENRLRKKENLFFPKVRRLLGIGCYEVATTTQVSTKESLKGIKDLSFTEAATAIQLACIKLHRKRRRQQQQNCQFSPTVVIL